MLRDGMHDSMVFVRRFLGLRFEFAWQIRCLRRWAELFLRSSPMNNRSLRRHAGFTLIELLVVITILGILMSLAVNGAGAIRSQARTAQARNDCTGLSTAIRQFYTDYSRYPVPASQTDDTAIEATSSVTGGNKEVILALSGKDATINPRGVQYYENKTAKLVNGAWTGGISKEGGLFDPWGYTYGVCVDGDFDGTLQYSGSVLKYYATKVGDTEDSLWKGISGGVGVFSLGKDHCESAKNKFAPGILSWY